MFKRNVQNMSKLEKAQELINEFQTEFDVIIAYLKEAKSLLDKSDEPHQATKLSDQITKLNNIASLDTDSELSDIKMSINIHNEDIEDDLDMGFDDDEDDDY